MSNAREHMFFGFIVGAVGYAVVKHLQGEEINFGNALGWGMMGAGVAILPDVIEPASAGPTHRAFAHSAATAGLIAYTAKKALDSPQLSSDQKAALTSVSAAYLSHLLLDSTTPSGLPLI